MRRAALCIYMSMCVVAAAPCFAVEARLDADSLVYNRPKPPPGRSVGAVLKDPEGVEWLVKCTPSNRHTADILFATSVLNDRESRSRHVRAAQAREVLRATHAASFFHRLARLQVTIRAGDGSLLSLLATRMVNDWIAYDNLPDESKRSLRSALGKDMVRVSIRRDLLPVVRTLQLDRIVSGPLHGACNQRHYAAKRRLLIG